VHDGEATLTETVFSADGPSFPVPGSFTHQSRYEVVCGDETTLEPFTLTFSFVEPYCKTQRLAFDVLHERVEFCTAPIVVGYAWNVTDGVAKAAAETETVAPPLAAGPSLPFPGSFAHHTR
jgi:hypothetical protein